MAGNECEPVYNGSQFENEETSLRQREGLDWPSEGRQGWLAGWLAISIKFAAEAISMLLRRVLASLSHEG